MKEGSPLDLGALAAGLRRHSDDLSVYSGFLLNVLSAALPPQFVRVTREGRWKARLARREPGVLGVAVAEGDQRDELYRGDVGAGSVAEDRHEVGSEVLATRTEHHDG